MAYEVLTVVLVIVGLILLYFIYTYNKLISLRNQINNAWSQIDVQLKRRFDLIPNLVETVKGYMKHEKSTFEAITEARNIMGKATSLNEKAKADDILSGALKTIFAVSENYPRLKASENFMQLQEELSGTESKIAYARQFYNDTVLTFNDKVQKFPSNLLAGIAGFATREFFKAEEEARKAVQVKF
ncbi:LemA family protein [Candidatus Woesearchaeota archaeon]|nr:LemA family protein [Candidatus Woesearchaeota archaeon]